MKYSISGNVVDVISKQIYAAEVFIENGCISNIVKKDIVPDVFIMPGFIDAHIHIESSMLVPQEFAKLAVRHGTVSVVSDPHEIANVLGIAGIDFMIENAKIVPFKFNFGVPSCVPATNFETSGFVLDSANVDDLLQMEDLIFLSEMMNYPGVIYEDEEVIKKCAFAKKCSKPIDGHAPGLKGNDLKKYVSQGITTDHESVSLKEAIEKIQVGMKIQIREGSAAKNFEELHSLIDQYPDNIMFCTDDCHPDDLLENHIKDLVVRALKKGMDFFNVLRCASFNPIKHYDLEVGLVQKGDSADFIIVKDVVSFDIIATFIDGKKVYDGERVLFKTHSFEKPNNFNILPIKPFEIALKIDDKNQKLKVIVAKDCDLYTGVELLKVKRNQDGCIKSDVDADVLKIVVVNRYRKEKVVVGLIKNFGFKMGAIAQSIAHDSHNIIAIGVEDQDIINAINLIIKRKGGMVACFGKENIFLPLPVAGLMSDKSGEYVALKYQEMNEKIKKWGSQLKYPFMTLSFMSLLVIPELKIGDKGLFDGNRFEFTSICSNNSFNIHSNAYSF